MDSQSGVGKERASEAFRKRNARSKSRERALEDAMATDRGGGSAGGGRSSRRGTGTESTDEESRDRFDPTTGLQRKSSGTGRSGLGRSAARAAGRSGGTATIRTALPTSTATWPGPTGSPSTGTFSSCSAGPTWS